MAQPSDVNVDDLRRRARRRLVGAIVLALSAAVFVPMLLESEPRPLGEDVSVKIPPVDNNKFVNKLNAKGGSDAAKTAPGKADTPKVESPKADAPKGETPKAEVPRSEAPKAGADPAAILAGGPTNVPPQAPSTTAPAAPAPDSSAAAAPRKSLAEAEQKVLSASNKAPAAAPPAVPATAPKATTPAEAPKAEPPKAESAKVEARKSEPPKADAAKAAAVGPGFSVQLAAFTDDKGANSLVNKLTKAGYVAYVEPVTNTKGTLWRVRVGPFPTRDAAGTSRDKLKGDGYSGIVTPSK